MNAIDFIQFSLKSSKNWAMELLNDIQDEPLTQPTLNGGILLRSDSPKLRRSFPPKRLTA